MGLSIHLATSISKSHHQIADLASPNVFAIALISFILIDNHLQSFALACFLDVIFRIPVHPATSISKLHYQ